MRTTKKLSAGALQYVVFISVIIALFISAFMLLLYLNNLVKLKANTFQKQVQKTQSAFDYVCQNNIAYRDSISLPNIEENKEIEQAIKTLIYKTNWGILDKVDVTSQFKNQTSNKTALIGGYTKNRPALYLQATNKPLVLVGDTQIIGTAYLPSQGVKRGNIAGKSFTGKQLIVGTKRSSRRNLPSIHNRDYLRELCKGNHGLETELFFLDKERQTTEGQLIHSFTKKTKSYATNQLIDLKNIDITGNYIIQSNTLIRVHASARLKDIILIAPEIEIEENVNGNFQAFASKHIYVKPNAILNYPSALVVSEDILKAEQSSFQNNNQTNPIGITLSEQVHIKGSVVFLSNNVNDNFQTQINLPPLSHITGEVYGERNIALQGSVNGTVLAKNVITNAFGSVYVNHLYNTTINSSTLPKSFGSLLYKKQDKTVVQWLY